MAVDYTTIPLKVAPSAATSTTLTASGTAWANPAWTQMIASTSNSITIAGIVVLTNGTNLDWEIDIGVGASGSEVVVGTMRGTSRTSGAGIPQSFYFPLPILVSGGSKRISARIRKAGTATTGFTLAIMYYDGDISSTAGTTTAVAKSIPSAAAGTTLSPSGVSWGSSSYVQLRAATGSALVLGGIVLYAGVAQPYEIDIATGGSGSETVIATFRGNYDSAAGVNNLVYANPPIDNIAANTRIAARIRINGTNTTAWRIALIVYEKPI